MDSLDNFYIWVYNIDRTATSYWPVVKKYLEQKEGVLSLPVTSFPANIVSKYNINKSVGNMETLVCELDLVEFSEQIDLNKMFVASTNNSFLRQSNNDIIIKEICKLIMFKMNKMVKIIISEDEQYAHDVFSKIVAVNKITHDIKYAICNMIITSSMLLKLLIISGEIKYEIKNEDGKIITIDKAINTTNHTKSIVATNEAYNDYFKQSVMFDIVSLADKNDFYRDSGNNILEYICKRGEDINIQKINMNTLKYGIIFALKYCNPLLLLLPYNNTNALRDSKER